VRGLNLSMVETQSHQQHVGGVPLPLGDVHIWAAIRYLDSPTD